MQRLMNVALIKSKAHRAYITFIRYRNGFADFIIKEGTPVDVDRIPKILKKYKGDMRIINTKESGFSVKISSLVQETMLEKVDAVLEDILTLYKTSE